MPHAIFPYETDDDEDPRDISYLRVGRREGAGAFVWAPATFAASDLPDWPAVFEQFGGGCYTIVARDSKNGRITARVNDYVMPGAPKPLVPHADPAPIAAPAAPGAPAPAPTNSSPLATLATVVGVLTPIVAPVLAYLAEGRKSHDAMMLSILTQARGDSQATAQAMVRAAETSQTTMAQYFSNLAAHAGGGRGGDGGAAELIQLGATLAQRSSGGDGDDLLATLSQIASGAEAMATAKREEIAAVRELHERAGAQAPEPAEGA